MMYRPTAALGIVAAALLAAGCSSSSSNSTSANPPPNPPAPVQSVNVRFVHAVADAPSVDIGGPVSTFVADLAFKEASAWQSFPVGALNVRVDADVPGGAATVIGPVDLTLAADNRYSVIAVGEVATIDALVLAGPATAVPATAVRARVVHAAPNAPAVDVYVTAPTDELASAAPLGSFAFGEDLGPVEVPAGEYRIRVTVAGDSSAVAFDSGTVPLPGGADLLVVAVENTGPGAAPISLVVADGSGSAVILDAATPAEIRAIHASPDAPAVDVIVNDDFANPVLANVPYPAVSDYLAVPADTYNVKVTATGNPGAIVIDQDLTVAAGERYSVYAVGPLASIAPYVLVDDLRPLATEARVRLIHLAPSAGLVDIYVTAPGAELATATPAFAGVDFLAETGYVSLPGGEYDVTVTVAGTKTAAIGPATVMVADGGVYTAAARDAAGGGAPFGLIVLDDFAL